MIRSVFVCIIYIYIYAVVYGFVCKVNSCLQLELVCLMPADNLLDCLLLDRSKGVLE